MLYFEFLFLLAFLYLGSRFGGMGLAVISGLGLLIEVFVFRLMPGKPPISVMLIILAVVCCASILEAAGGLKYMLQVAERILRRNPKYITFLGPSVTYTMTFMLGTGHAVYSVMPIIADVALKNGIRPERPMAAASVASQLAITASPISAAVVFYAIELVQLPGFENLNVLHILMVTMPATFIGTLALSLYSLRRGQELSEDREYQRRLQDPIWRERIEQSSSTTLNEALPASARHAVYWFLLALLSIVALAVFKDVRLFPGANGKIIEVKMDVIIQMLMLAFGGIILLVTRTNVQLIPNTVVFKSGMVAALAIFGIAWMSDTYFQAAIPVFRADIEGMVRQHPWTFALALFMVSVLVNSQAATAKMLLPVGMAMGVPAPILIGLMPACYGYFFIPNYPSDIATVNFDVSGSTKIGKYYFNHSFMAPGLIGVVVACCVGVLLAQALL